MENSYKLVLQMRHSYREAELTPATENGFRIGTSVTCDMRYRKELFFEDFYLEFTRERGSWQLHASENIHVTQDGVLKLQSLKLEHGMHFSVYSSSDMELFRCSFLLDFERLPRRYTRAVDFSGVDHISIGGQGQHILLDDELVGQDTITLVRQADGLRLSDNKTRYGVSFNGALIDGPVTVREFDFFSLAGYSFCLRGNTLLTDDLPTCTIRLPYTDLPESCNTFVYPQFNRSVRFQRQVPEEEIEILPASAKKERKRRSLLFSLIPALLMLVLLVVLRGILGSGGTFVIYSVCSMAIGIVMSVATYLADKRDDRLEEEKRQREYRAYLEDKCAKIEALRCREQDELNYIYTNLEEDLGCINAFDVRLFERSQEDPDYLQVYLGRGRIAAPNPVKITPQEFYQEDDVLAGLPEETAERYRYLNDAPITAGLRVDNCLGVVGMGQAIRQMVWNLSLDLCARHFFRDIRLIYLLGDEAAAEFAPLRWLPHIKEGEQLRCYGCDEESRSALLEMLYANLSSREKQIQDAAQQGEIQLSPHFVVFVYGVNELKKHPISRYFECAAQLGCTFVFFVSHREMLPRGCGEVLLMNDSHGATLLSSAQAANKVDFTYTCPDSSACLAAIQKLSAVKVEEISLESELTQHITLFELLGIMAAEDLDLETRWRTAQVFRSMSAPIGIDRKKELVCLDIGDKASAHGPHGLVAGTTGSGKSELLQTYILSMSTLFHPYDVGFLIIDFKGGGMANQFHGLPHLLSSITNIDGREIDRSLRSIKAELLRRQEIFAASGVNHINDYIKQYKSGNVNQPLPHLIIIVDEFAELKNEFPEFMKELISAARIGRTLGVHLILATQKPSGVVDAQIWANSKFRLCLKVQSKEDSNEVLKSPLAAEIKEPGRAYFQVGNNEIFELFQSAYGGAPIPDLESAKSQIYQISEVNPWGKRELIYSNKIDAHTGSDVSQLEAMVSHIGAYCAEQGIQPLPGICLPPLSDALELAQLHQPVGGSGIQVAVGWMDNPDQQRQDPLVLDLTAANTFVVGSSQMGKTTLLRTIATAIIQSYSVQDVNLYLIDCGNMSLKVLEDARHVGGVVLATEEERMENLFKLLFRCVEQRRSHMAERGVGTYSDYLEAGFRDIPQIVVLLDNISAFREYYDKLMDSLLVLTREGLSVGISFVLTASQANGLSYKSQANFNRRIVFTCTDSSEYSTLLGRSRLTPKPIAGRALTLHDKQILECQIALTGASLREIERVEALRSLIEARNGETEGAAVPIPMVPDALPLEQVFTEHPELFRTPGCLPIGLDYNQVEFVCLDLFQCVTCALLGSDHGGRRGFLMAFLEELQRTIVLHPTEVYIFDNSSRELEGIEKYGMVHGYCSDPAEAVAYVEELCDHLHGRSQEKKQDTRLVVVLEDRTLLQNAMKDKETAGLLLQLMKDLQKCGGLLLVSGLENTALSFNASEFFKQLREHRCGLLFGNLSDCRFYEVNMKQSKEFTRSITKGDAYFFQEGALMRLKTIQSGGKGSYEDGRQ